MAETQLRQGLVKISDYKALLQSALFSHMEKFSNGFIARNKHVWLDEIPLSKGWKCL
ncbi:unnamed protein product [marine sediment metagenome]|uniref:Uncharacterized protein n=1 Tax=marine sediment metagenome TaxID=412755 RepID=X1VG36_9ZZZZ